MANGNKISFSRGCKFNTGLRQMGKRVTCCAIKLHDFEKKKVAPILSIVINHSQREEEDNKAMTQSCAMSLLKSVPSV